MEDQIENITDEEIKKLIAAATEEDEDGWHNICREIKAKRGGQYPPDWYSKVIGVDTIVLLHTVQLDG